jgi:hypothetical protein
VEVLNTVYWVVCFERPVFELRGSQDCTVRVHFTSTGDKVYGSVPGCPADDSSLSLVGGAHRPPVISVNSLYTMCVSFAVIFDVFLVLVTWLVCSKIFDAMCLA